MIRIIGGKYKHRIINQPPMEITRCTKDMAKEGLFNSLGDITNLSFLDLFSGSGNIAIEAFSRGANKVYLNEYNKTAYKVILENLSSLNIKEIITLNKEANSCLEYLSEKNISFDIIFLDPPYKFIMTQDFINKFYSLNLLNKDARIILETEIELKENDFDLFNIKVLKYGRTYMNILRRK